MDWRDESIYFVMTDRFKNGDASNDLDSQPGKTDWWQGGDLRGLIEQLGYIKSLGMTAIWITPVSRQTPGGYHGYWTLDFYAVDPHLGDLGTLKELVRKAHAIGLKVVLDVVINHTGYGHPWLEDPARAGWFHEECAISFSSQRSIEECWLAGLPDLNTENPAVRKYLTDWTLWLIREADIDGFRLDTARHVPKEFLREWTTALKREKPSLWILGEVFTADYKYQAQYLDVGLDAITDFQTYESIKQGLAERPDLSRLTWPPALATNLLPAHENARATFIDNHDVPRFVGRSEPDEDTKRRLARALVYLFTMPGTPVLYYGTEIALRGGPDPDNRRVMPWDERNADVRALATRVAALRRDHAVLRRGEFRELQSGDTELVYARVLGGDLAIVAFNGSDDKPMDVRLEARELPSRPPLQGALDAVETSASFDPDGALLIHLPPRAVQVWLPAPPPAATPSAPLALGVLAGLIAIGGAIAIVLIVRRARV